MRTSNRSGGKQKRATYNSDSDMSDSDDDDDVRRGGSNRKASQKVRYEDTMSLVVRKPVFRVSDQVRHKPDCTATEDLMARALKFRI